MAPMGGECAGWVSVRRRARVEKVKHHIQLELGDVLTVSAAPREEPVTEESEMVNGTSAVIVAQSGWVPKANKPTVAFVKISPKVAAEWLDYNTRNRAPSDETIERYQRAVSEGRWLVSPQGIGWSKTQEIVDGQQRLMAVVRAGRSITTLVAYGLDPEVIDVLDEQRKRSAANALQIRGEDNAAKRSAIARAIFSIGSCWNKTPSNQETLRTLDAHTEAIEWIVDVQRETSATLDSQFHADISAAFCVAWEKDKKKIDALARSVWRGTGLEKGTPQWVLLRYLKAILTKKNKVEQRKDATGAQKLDTKTDRLNKVLRACYAAVRGERAIDKLCQSKEATEYYLSNREELIRP